MKMKIIDTHTHVVENVHGYARRGEFRAIGNGRARWANGEEVMLIPPELGDRDVQSERLYHFLKQHNVERAVLLQGSFYGYQNEYSMEAARQYPDMFLAACSADPFAGEAMSILERFVCAEGFRVIKLETSDGGGLMGFHQPFRLDGPRIAPMVALAAREHCTFVIDIGSPSMKSFQPEAVAEIARSYPHMKVVVCHLMAPTLADEATLTQALHVLRLPNIWFDLSAIPWNITPEPYPYPTGQRYVRIARDVVGHKQLMWGSDLPSPLTRDSYEHLCDYLLQADGFTQRELDDMYYYNALDAYPFQK